MRGLIFLLLIGVLLGCHRAESSHARRAQALIATHCAACHRVPGIALATGRVGPSLAHIGTQQMIAGFFPNNPQMLIEWIEHPQKLLPGNAMPEMGLSHEDAATIVDYLYTME
jgi:cytochrome c1